ncbi:helix-turn-helix transcriptional regulator [Nocardia sp. CC201C]|uniref:helix-turn-helix domain-containing protein n=1 Tax=Nocardia sp. CC201C TaxID=3044575 RepID=UPI0024A7C216|nr:helix-turn-helix transcriptional regulator [Nocardia sp. CC201C]
MGDPNDGVGKRISTARKMAGMTQRQLAAKANVSYSAVSKAESGERAATAPLIAACAKALRVSITDLTGQPYTPTTKADRELHAAISLLRSELVAYDLDDPDLEVRPLPQITEDVLAVRRMRRDVAAHKLAAALPHLLTETRALAHRKHGQVEGDRAFVLLAELYYSARSMAHKLGYLDLSAMAIDRMSWAAEKSGDPLWIAASQFHRASLLTSGGDYRNALAFLERSRAEVEARLGTGEESDLIAWGGLHLQSGLAAARAGDQGAADAHLAEATDTAARLGHDRDPVLTFGPVNVAIWGVSLGVEAMDSAKALDRAASLVLPPGTPRSRSGHHYIDVGRAWLLQGGHHRDVMKALLTAKSIAPSMVRYHPMVHETVLQLAREEARATESVRGFATWCGLT